MKRESGRRNVKVGAKHMKVVVILNTFSILFRCKEKLKNKYSFLHLCFIHEMNRLDYTICLSITVRGWYIDQAFSNSSYLFRRIDNQ